MERVDNFYVYFKQMKVLTDTFESLYDGDELGDPERVQQLWADAQGQNQGQSQNQGQTQNQNQQGQPQAQNQGQPQAQN